MKNHPGGVAFHETIMNFKTLSFIIYIMRFFQLNLLVNGRSNELILIADSMH
jgi:hypothetical protein